MRGLPTRLLALYIICYADVVLVLQLAGLFSALNFTVVFALQLAATAIAGLIWFLRGRPSLLTPCAGLAPKVLLTRSNLLALLRQPLLILVALGVGLAYLVQARMILVSPIDEIDSLLYHLTRVGFWHQYQSLYPWPTPNLRQTTFPMNAELGVLWTVFWWGSDQLAGFVQWTTVPVIAIGIFGLARLLGYPRSQAALVALLWPTLTQVLYQSTTAQNDLVTASFWVAAIYFLFTGLRQQSRGELYLSGAALGLALGAKYTSLMALPALALVIGINFLAHRHEPATRSLLVTSSISGALGFLLFGSYVFMQNWLAFGHPLGAESVYVPSAGMDEAGGSLARRAELLRDNVARYVFQLVDFAPMPAVIHSHLNPVKQVAIDAVFDWIGSTPSNPETIDYDSFNAELSTRRSATASWFGPLTAFLIPAILYHGARGVRKRDFLRISLALIPIGFLLLHSAAQPWDSAKGRYYLLPVALSFPLLASVLGTMTLLKRLLKAFVVLLGLTVMFTMLLHILAERHIRWNHLLLGPRDQPSWTDEFTYRMLTEHVPFTASVGVARATEDKEYRDYPFFGDRLSRLVTLAVPDDESILPPGDLGPFRTAFEASDFLVTLGMVSPVVGDLVSNDFSALSTNGDESLWIRSSMRAPDSCDQAKWPFTKVYRSSTQSICPRFPIILGIAVGRMYNDFTPVVGPGLDMGFRFDILVAEEVEAIFSIDVDPEDAQSTQTLNFVLTDAAAQSRTFSRSFVGVQMLEFAAPVHPGGYHLQVFMSEDSGTTRIQKIQARTE